jgi:two-component system, chemotaxis family, chemotaxis protein CheY
VGEASDGQRAIEQYTALRPSVCTLDLVMPQFDGLHALRGILEIDPQAKIVVVSALDQKTVLKNAFHLGASDFLVKPFEKDTLVNTLENLVAQALDETKTP